VSGPLCGVALALLDPWAGGADVGDRIPDGSPDLFTVQWHDVAVEFCLVRHSDGRPARYLFACPQCGGVMYLQHRITFGPAGATFDNPRASQHSLQCPRGCGWHVFVRNGRATDA
jgi:ribosomal protein S27AE